MSPPSSPTLTVPPSGTGVVVLDLLDNVTGAPPRQATSVHISRDARCLRVEFHCEDEHPWATIHRYKGPLYEEETVEVFLDPFGDLQCYFEIEVNPLNTVLDLMLRRVGKGWRKDLAWQCEGLETSASLTDSGWSATLLIPFASIAPHAPRPGEVWRANFLRIDRPEGMPRELSAWSPTRLNTFHDCSRFGFLEF